MNLLLPEFDPRGEKVRLLISIKGDRACLAVLRAALGGMSAELTMEGENLSFMAPVAADSDLVLAAVAAAVDRINAGSGRPEGVVLSETRMVPALPRPAEEVVRLGGRFRVLAASHPRQVDKDTILLAGGSVFGSGLHPSTRLAVRAMVDLARQEEVFPGRVLDVGTGSGLLAIIAARQGAATVLGIDISAEAVATAGENIALNRLGNRILIAATPLAEIAGSFNLMLANLTASVQLRLALDLQARMEPGCELILSGLQGRQRDELAEFWRERGLRLIRAYREGVWGALWLRNKSLAPDGGGPENLVELHLQPDRQLVGE